MKRIIIAIILMATTIGFVKAENVFIWEKARTTGYAEFYKAMEAKGWTTPSGQFKVEGLCTIAFNTASNQKLIGGGVTPQAYCESFLKLNLITKTTVAPVTFKAAPWKLPVMDGGQAKKATVASAPVKSATVSPRLAPKLVDYGQSIGALKQSLEVLKNRSDVGDEKVSANLQEFSGTIKTLEAGFEKLQSGELSPELENKFIAMMDLKVSELDTFKKDVFDRLGLIEGDIKTLTENSATKTELGNLQKQVDGLAGRVAGHDDQLKARQPFGFDFVKTVLGEGVAANYLASPTLIQGGSVLIFILSLFLVYANRIEKVRKQAEATDKKASGAVETANGAEAKSFVAQKLATEASKKVSEISEQVAGMIEYSFDQELVKREALEESIPNIGDSFPLLLDSADGDDITLEIMRSKANEITIKGALRQQGSKTPLSCGLDSAVVKINRAIRDGRIEKTATLKIAV